MEPVDLLRNVLKLIEDGGPVTEIATQLGITAQTEYNRQNQDQINNGVRLGMQRINSAGLSAERRRMRELEIEREITRRANVLLLAR